MAGAWHQSRPKLKSAKFVAVTATESERTKKNIGSYIAKRMGDEWGTTEKQTKTAPAKGLLSLCFYWLFWLRE